jgi:hypothetical protein
MLNLPNKPFPVIQKFLRENEILVYRYMVWAIYHAIKSDETKAELFSFAGGDNIAVVQYADYEKVLLDGIEKFTTAEDTAYVALTYQILDKLRVEQFLNEKPTE